MSSVQYSPIQLSHGGHDQICSSQLLKFLPPTKLGAAVRLCIWIMSYLWFKYHFRFGLRGPVDC